MSSSSVTLSFINITGLNASVFRKFDKEFGIVVKWRSFYQMLPANDEVISITFYKLTSQPVVQEGETTQRLVYPPPCGIRKGSDGGGGPNKPGIPGGIIPGWLPGGWKGIGGLGSRPPPGGSGGFIGPEGGCSERTEHVK